MHAAVLGGFLALGLLLVFIFLLWPTMALTILLLTAAVAILCIFA